MTLVCYTATIKRCVNMSDMSKRIYNLRKEQNKTLEDIATVVGVGKSTVRKWETGMIANMRRDKIAKLAEALNTTPAYLMGWVDNEETEKKNDTITDIILKLRSDSELLNMVKDICELSPDKRSAVQNLIFAFNNNK